MNLSHPFLSSHCKNRIVSKAIIRDQEKFVVYSDDTSFAAILGMGMTEGEALDKAEETVKKMESLGMSVG